LKKLLGWAWWRLWHLAYGRRHGWYRSSHMAGLNDATVVGYSAIRMNGDMRWFWFRNVDGVERLNLKQTETDGKGP
jgi:hypothetical protein